jgi:hypothetical protein
MSASGSGSRSILIFPWLRAGADVTIGPVTFTSLRALLPPEHQPLMAIFKYGNGRPIGDCMACEIAVESEVSTGVVVGVQFVVLRDPDAYADVLETYVLTVPPTADARVLIGTRLGGISSDLSSAEIRCRWPFDPRVWRVNRQDVEVAEHIATWATSRDPACLRLFRAAQLYVRSRLYDLSWQERMLLNAMAAEALLDLPDRHVHHEFKARFAALFGGAESVAEWADAAYGVRSQIAHGAADTDALRIFRPRSPVIPGGRRPTTVEPAGLHDEIMTLAIRNGILLRVLDLRPETVDVKRVKYLLITELLSSLYSPRTLVDWICSQSTDRLIRDGKSYAELQHMVGLLPDRPAIRPSGTAVGEWLGALRGKLQHVDKRDRTGRQPYTAVVRQALSQAVERVAVWQKLIGA